MRLILGMILGAALTVGGAYVSDTATKPTARAPRRARWSTGTWSGATSTALTGDDQAGLGQADR